MARLESSLFAPGAVDEIGPEDVISLATEFGEPAVSIYLPVGLRGDSIRDKLVLRDLIAQARTELAEDGYSSARIAEVLELPESILAEDRYFAQGMRGLAIFCGGGADRVYRLPLAPEPAFAVAGSPWVVPLLSVLEGSGDFLVIWLDLNDVRVYQATRFSLARLSFADVSTSIQDVLPEEDRQAHISARAEGTRRANRVAVFHARGVGDEVDKSREEHFLEILAAELAPYLAEWNVPVVVAGVGSLAASLAGRIARDNVVAIHVEGSPARADEREVHAQAWSAVESQLTATHRAAVERFSALAGTGLTTCELSDVSAAARQGRTETLLVTSTRPAWGRRPSGTEELEQHDYAVIGDVDLVGVAVADALASGAQVYLTRATEAAFSPLGAILRY